MFLIIDGSSLLTTAYYGTLPVSILAAKTDEEKKAHYGELLHSKTGLYTNAIHTMSREILEILSKQDISHIAFVFDVSRNTFRKFLYPAYKAQRGKTPEPLKDQFILMEKLLEDAGFKVMYSESVEADDYAGSLVKTFKGQEAIRLLTKDHDYMQLVDTDSNIKLWLMANSKDALIKMNSLCGSAQTEINKPDRTYECGDKEVYTIEGVLPEFIPDKKGMCGDTSDNIPGIKGIAEKTAVPLINNWGTLEDIEAMIDETSPDILVKAMKSIGLKMNPTKKLKEGKEIGRLSKDLATIRCDIPVDDNLDSYKIKKESIERFCKELMALDINV